MLLPERMPLYPSRTRTLAFVGTLASRPDSGTASERATAGVCAGMVSTLQMRRRMEMMMSVDEEDGSDSK